MRTLFVLCLFALAGTQGVSAQTPMSTCTELSTTYTDRDNVDQDVDIDKNNNGLIEICDLDGLNEIRNNPSGTGTEQQGCPSTGCRGFELTRDLDFNSTSSYVSGDINTAWTTGDGWQPIATFNTEFNGNGYTISNLYINRNSTDEVGLFGATGSNSVYYRAVGLLNVDIRGRNEVGSLVGGSAGGIASSYATGIVEGSGSVGGLVGENGQNATITDSCATSTVEGSGSVGGLVGHNLRGIITNSCATGTVLGSGSNHIGGLVGHNEQETIRNSYATGTVSGSGSDIGGLVGFNNTATIENSYATGDVKGSDSSSNVGGLVGQNDGTTFTDSEIKNSYATGSVSGSGSSVGGLVGRNDTGRGMITDSYWLRGSASSGGTGVDASTSKTAMELISPTAAEGIYSRWNPDDSDDWDFGTSNQFPTIRNSGSDVLTNLPLCTLDIPNADADDVKHAMDIDKDNDNLIEVCDLEGLDEMRYQLDGMGYKTTDSEMVAAITAGCPTTCTGFELARSLDFMASDSYRPATNEATWTTGGGWQPIEEDIPGSVDIPFNATFDGNGHTISKLMINRATLADSRIGLFSETGTSAEITNLGLLGVNIKGHIFTGSLVGQNLGNIANSYATGAVSGSDSNSRGGLAGGNLGTITNSYAMVSVSAPSLSNAGSRGGLVGANFNGGSITNSYATGTVGEPGIHRGGLVGWNFSDGSITNSYATGRVIAGSDSSIGGLAGRNDGNLIKDSYWLGGSAGSAGTFVDTDTSKTTVELTSPTRATGIYSDWGPDDWDFGTSNQFPALKYTKGTDKDTGTGYQACSDTPPQTGIDQPQCGTLLPGQGMNIGDSDLRESLRELNILGPRARLDMRLGVSTNNYVVTILLREVITTNTTASIVLRLKAYNPDAEIQIFKAGDSRDYFADKMSGDESIPIVVERGTRLTIAVSEPDTDYTLTFRVEEFRGIQVRIKVFLEGPLQ